MRIVKHGTIVTTKRTSINNIHKHIDTTYHFLRDTVQNILIKMKYCSINKQFVQPLTKSLLCVAHGRFFYNMVFRAYST